jgi:hypothetical protein
MRSGSYAASVTNEVLGAADGARLHESEHLNLIKLSTTNDLTPAGKR